MAQYRREGAQRRTSSRRIGAMGEAPETPENRWLTAVEIRREVTGYDCKHMDLSHQFVMQALASRS
jgi:hypothetical protein